MAKKSKKSHSTQATFAFFNAYNVEAPDMTFEKIRLRAFNILHRHKLPYNQWTTIPRLRTSLLSAWDYDMTEKDVKFYFRRWWLDRVVQEFGHMIWNAVNAYYYKRWYETGELPETDLPKKQRNGEGVSSYMADLAVNEFMEQYH